MRDRAQLVIRAPLRPWRCLGNVPIAVSLDLAFHMDNIATMELSDILTDHLLLSGEKIGGVIYLREIMILEEVLSMACAYTRMKTYLGHFQRFIPPGAAYTSPESSPGRGCKANYE